MRNFLQVLVLTHLMADPVSTIPYLCHRTKPVRPVEICGRSAKMEPKCDPCEAVWYGWKHRLLPYMLEPSHPDDILFLVAEEDFRFYKKDCAAEAKPVSEPSASGRASGSSGAAPSGGEPSAPCEGFVQFELDESLGGAPYKDGYSNELLDLVALCNAAHRQECGDFVWLSWCRDTGRRKKQRPGHGTTLVAVNKPGAAWMAAKCYEVNVEKGRRQHWDVFLLEKILQDEGRSLKSCFVSPSVGSFVTHKSGCEMGPGTIGGVRESDWHCLSQEGARPRDKRWEWQRSLRRFTAEGDPPTILGSVPLPESLGEYTWISARPGAAAQAQAQVEEAPPAPPAAPRVLGGHRPPPPPPRVPAKTAPGLRWVPKAQARAAQQEADEEEAAPEEAAPPSPEEEAASPSPEEAAPEEPASSSAAPKPTKRKKRQVRGRKTADSFRVYAGPGVAWDEENQ